MKLWGGRFDKPTDGRVDAFTASIHFDKRLASFDICGSIAHVKSLGNSGLLSNDEVDKLVQGLQNVAGNIESGTAVYKLEDEDIHMNVERLLYAEIGDLAGKMHTGRSRNDQVALDMHLYMRDQVFHMIGKLQEVQRALYQKAEQHIDTILPGYTHLQRAKPVRFAHHLLAYVAMFQRDIERLIDSWKRINISPLGVGALAGCGVDIDRHYTAKLLNFDGIYENSMDAVSDRDYMVEFQTHAAMIMMHLSRLGEEFVLWASQEFSFITIDDAFCTGSSMMPQKKNPDVPELLRGKTGRVYGALTSILTTLKALPLAYNKDLQEDKEGLFDTLDTLNNTLPITAAMIESTKVNSAQMLKAVEQDYSSATELANYLVKKGVPFRVGHEVAGKIVRYCIDHNLYLKELSLQDYQRFSEHFGEDIHDSISIKNVVDSHRVVGGTAKEMVVQQMKHVRDNLQNTSNWLNKNQSIIEIAL